MMSPNLNPQALLKKKYLTQLRVLLPVMRKEERTYLRHMETTIDEFLDASDSSAFSCMENFYREFGEPREVIQNYYSGMNIESFCSVISIRRFLKRIGIFLCSLMLAAAIFWGYVFWQEHLIFLQSKPANIYTIRTQK